MIFFQTKKCYNLGKKEEIVLFFGKHPIFDSPIDYVIRNEWYSGNGDNILYF